MSRDQRHMLLLAAVLVAAAAAGWVLSAGGLVKVSATAEAATEAAGWEPDYYGPAYGHLWHPYMGSGDPARRLRRHHRLYARPGCLGGDRAKVAAEGWAWFADPPGSEGL